MQRRPFGPSRVPLPVLGQGTWNLELDDRSSAIAALRRGLDLGLTHVDTAELYGDGAVETLLGEALSGRRDEVYLVSKVLPSNASRAGTSAPAKRRCGASRPTVSTCISSTGPAVTRSPRPWRPSSSSPRAGRSAPGA